MTSRVKSRLQVLFNRYQLCCSVGFRNSSDAERVAACNAMARVCVDNAGELAELLTKEQGKPLNGLGSRFEMGGCAGWAGYTASIGLHRY